MRFRNRREAGRRLALALRLWPAPLGDPVLLALPRGGVPVGYEVARALGVTLEVLVACKIGAPGQPELGIAAIAEALDEPVVTPLATRLGLGPAELAVLAARERVNLADRVRRYRPGRDLPPLGGREVVVIDDGLATGVTAEAALRAVRRQQPSRLWLAVPVCAPETAERLRGLADEVICVIAPDSMQAVGVWYDDFTQTTDAEVVELLGAVAV